MSRIAYLLSLSVLLVVLTAADKAPDERPPGEPIANAGGESFAKRVPTDSDLVNKEMAKLAKSCFKCHAAPVRDLVTDTAWINSIPETT